MELVTLSDTFEPVNLIENYSSLIWTERYSTNGDFELQSSEIDFIRRLLPRESCISLRDSLVPMMVENHVIKKPMNGPPVLSVTGRSFETVLERRWALKGDVVGGASITPWDDEKAEKESDAAYQVIRQVLGDNQSRDVPVPPNPDPTSPLPPVWPPSSGSVLDAIPEIDLVVPSDYVVGSTNTYPVKFGNLYSVVMEMLNVNHHGLKANRPMHGEGKIGIEIYNGVDRTSTVSFDARFTQFDSATYLFSEQGSTNVGYVIGPTGSLVVPKTTAPEASGLKRRVLGVDRTSGETGSTPEALKAQGLIELYQNNVSALFAGEVSIQIASGFNKEYFLGDIVSLVGEYGLDSNVRVAEFIRTEDATGRKSYPTFEVVTE